MVIALSNIQSDKLERLSKTLLIQQLNERPLVFVRFDDMPQTFCIVGGKFLVTKEAAISYFFSHFFHVASSSKVSDILYRQSTEICAVISESDSLDDWIVRSDYFSQAWNLAIEMREKFEPKEVLGWALEKNVKVI